MREKSSLNILSKEPRWSCSETNNFGVFPFKQSMFLFLRENEKASLLIIIGGVKFLKVFQIDVRFIKHALFFDHLLLTRKLCREAAKSSIGQPSCRGKILELRTGLCKLEVAGKKIHTSKIHALKRG